MTSITVQLRQLVPAPFGCHTRFVFAAYFRDTFLLLSIVLIVAISIDLTKQISGILSVVSADTLFDRTLFIGWYLVLRAADRAAEFLPFACFFGVLWAEMQQTLSGERLAVSISGRAPMQCLIPLVLFAVLSGFLQFVLLVFLRPAAVMEQTVLRVGEYGQTFDRSKVSQPEWIVAGDNLVRANIEFTSPPVLHNVRIIQFDSNRKVRSIVDADYAAPIAGEKLWVAHDGHLRKVQSGDLIQTTFTEKQISLDIDPLWLRYFGIGAQYLPNDIFNALGRVRFSPDSDYRTWAQARFGIPVTTAAMVTLAGALSLLFLALEIRLTPLAGIVLAGYGAFIGDGIMLVFGQHGWLHPILAVWIAPFVVLIFPIAFFNLLRLVRGPNSPASVTMKNRRQGSLA